MDNYNYSRDTLVYYSVWQFHLTLKKVIKYTLACCCKIDYHFAVNSYAFIYKDECSFLEADHFQING